MLQLARHLESASNDGLVMQSASGERQLMNTSDKSMDVLNQDIKLLIARDLSHILDHQVMRMPMQVRSKVEEALHCVTMARLR